MEPNRRNWLKQISLGLAGIALARLKILAAITQPLYKKSPGDIPKQLTKKESNMKLGVFSISLAVNDINASKQFYENLGFKVFAGDLKKNYLIMKNEHSLIGLFHGCLRKTF